jgi:uncharacterized repeat protein (TIGR03803 family)
VLYNFSCGTDGCEPYGNLTPDSDGNLYGTTVSGGNSTCACGTVFELTPVQGGGWTESVLYAFMGGLDGSTPQSGVIFDTLGNLYGVTYDGGTDSSGTVFKLTHSGSNWTESVINDFSGGSDGRNPLAGLVFDPAGNLYGTTGDGGAYSGGTVFELSPTAEGWSEIVLHSFGYGQDGASPNTKLAIDSLGDLYGTTSGGGTYGYGSVLRVVPSDTGWTETTIWDFTPGTPNGLYPNGVIAHGHALYGTTFWGGMFNVGDVFQLTPAVGIWNYTVIYSFTGGHDGGSPYAGLTADRSHLYGTTFNGGRYGLGTAFRLTESNGAWAEQVLYNFTGSADGENPYGPLLLAPGSLFGFANISPGGLVYEITAP